MREDYEASHEYIEPEAEERIVDDRTVDFSQNILRFTRYLLLCILVISIAVTIVKNRDSFNVDNLRRLFAKIDIGISYRGDVDGKQVELSYADDSSVATFKDGMAYLTPSKLTIMDNLGTVFMATETGFTHPELVASDKYCIAFDRGGNHLIVTNSFAVVFDITFKESISYVSLNSVGYLAVITTGGGYKNTLYVYDSSFKEIYVWHSNDRYLLSVAVSTDRKNAALSCYNVKDAANVPELVGLKFDSEEIAWNMPLDHGLPLDIRYKNSSLIAAVHTDALVFYNSKGKTENTYEFEKSFLQHFRLDHPDFTVLVSAAGRRGNSTVYVVNNRGKVTATHECDTMIEAMDLKQDKIAMITDEKVLVCSSASGKTVFEKESLTNAQTVCFGGKNCVLDIYKTYAVYNEIK